MITIDKNVPMVDKRGNRIDKYPFSEMEVGDSFFIPNKKSVNLGSTLNNQKRNGKDYKSRTITENGIEGTRIWRIK